jgi:hypothetical protein
MLMPDTHVHQSGNSFEMNPLRETAFATNDLCRGIKSASNASWHDTVRYITMNY